MKKSLPYHYRYFLNFLFIIALSNLTHLHAQSVDYGKSYTNLSKGISGGTMEPGDTLQIRATFVVKAGTLDSCGFFDNVPVGTSYIPGSLAVITNEGKVYKSFTDVAGDDCGYLTGTAIRINLGFNTTAGKQATAFKRGQIKNTDIPSFFGNTCIMVASYKVIITAALGSQINLGGGSFSSKSGTGPIINNVFPANNVAIFTNYGLCANAVGANALGTEFNGTFGSGKNKDRGASANVPASYTYATFGANMPNDYYYGISNNTSTTGAGYSTVNTWAKPDLSATSHRVFGVWDIIGDHTGAISPTAGNPPADTVANNNAGYMLVINASYRIDSAFNQTISGLCPNTYYEFSLWIRNICSKCGCDINGKGASAAGYIPTGTGDSSGVKPNLTFAINGIDYYTTGDVQYTGQWIKKGFTYLTGPTQTSISAMVRNNAPGGGGNDWAIDDITLATCTPNLVLNPSPSLSVCFGNQVNISSVISSYFSNYIYWRYERSIDNGVTWTNTGTSGTGTPVLNAGQWTYTAIFPSFLADSNINHAQYRIVVASTSANLNNPSCSFSATTIVNVLTSSCTALLDTRLKYFNGRINDPNYRLDWATENETPGLNMDLEKSTDGIHFQKITSINGNAGSGGAGNYFYTDYDLWKGPAYFRLKLVNNDKFLYSRIIVLSSSAVSNEVGAVVNPFDNYITFDITLAADNQLSYALYDIFGRAIRQKKEKAYQGINKITIDNLDQLSDGAYILHIEYAGKSVNRKIIKFRK